MDSRNDRDGGVGAALRGRPSLATRKVGFTVGLRGERPNLSSF
jgi:hypothetical protein